MKISTIVAVLREPELRRRLVKTFLSPRRTLLILRVSKATVKGAKLYDEEKYAEALEWFEYLRKLDGWRDRPDEFLTYARMAKCYAETGNEEKAVEYSSLSRKMEAIVYRRYPSLRKHANEFRKL